MTADVASACTLSRNGAERTASDPGGLTVGLLVASEVISFGLRAMLEATDIIKDVQECRPGSAVPDNGLDILILCGRQFTEAPAEAALENAAANGTKIIVILEDDTGEYFEQAFRTPCHGFILQRELSVDVLRTTISRMHCGEIPMPGAMARNLIAAANGAERRPQSSLASLTPREQQTLDLLVKGLSNKQIARQLLISQHGAKRLVANILAKLNCENRTLAVAIALRDREMKGRQITSPQARPDAAVRRGLVAPSALRRILMRISNASRMALLTTAVVIASIVPMALRAADAGTIPQSDHATVRLTAAWPIPRATQKCPRPVPPYCP